VISFQEEDRIARCLESMAFCEELLVLDSGSTDRTVEIARELGARVERQVPFLGHRAQKQRAVELAGHDWILSLDADEWLSEELEAEIQRLRREPEFAGPAAYSMPRKNRYLGRWMRHGKFWPDTKIRLFDRRRAFWGGRDPHDRVELMPGVADPVRPLKAALCHDSYRDFGEHQRTVERFTDIAAQALWEEGRRAGLFAPWTHGAFAFFSALIPKMAVLDGWRGGLAAWMAGRYGYLKYRKLRSLQKKVGS
jgi:glycosyltransferase involved in cell wall biosynthesis